ncbi:coiled-coil domain-containing protein 151 isoform X2 [Electrophorus electricus]|uniref:coiled-coil domain-containing protein 151 isoform X2 n=1 Tax=Electrophorus electricus TaxID=8005 RepID=UPI0015D07354|nr:coiled-coil domain-containing protein 151 isoform X2 [Electrophorus electricus]
MPGTFSSGSIKPPIHNQIVELQRKIQLLEGDRSAYYESSQTTIKKNKSTILQLRLENKLLHKKLAEALAGDEQVIREAFQNHGSEKAALRNMSAKAAVQVLDQKVCDKMKKLNAQKYITQTYRRQLDELHVQFERARKERRGPPSTEDTTKEGDSADVLPQKNLRVLENRLEKAQLKCKEAEHIMRSYLKLKQHLQEESLSFQSQLDQLEGEILRQKQDLRELQVMNNDAHLAKDAAKAELQRQEELVYGERRKREVILSQYKKQVEERRAQAERGERRAQRAAVHLDELSSEAQHSVTGGGEEDRAMSSFEEAFHRIREATGVTGTQEVVDRFISQQDTQKHLHEMKLQNETILQQLKEERDSLHTQFQELKYSGESKLTSGRQMLEDCKQHLQREQQRRDGAKETLDRLTHLLNTVNAGVEHLTDKLQHIPLPKDGTVEQAVVDPAERILDLLRQAEWKLQQVQEELQDQDLPTLLKDMEDEEFQASIEGKLPQYNTRITLPETQRLDPYDEDEDSGDDEGDIITRASLKRQSQLIIDSKTKRKTRMKKRKGKL